MKTQFHFKSSFPTRNFLNVLSLILLLTILSCSKDTAACQDNNTGTIIIENSRVKGVLKIFFNKEPRSGNVGGDLNIQPGEKASSEQLGGQQVVYALLDMSTCNESGNQCMIQNTVLETKTVNLASCQDLNLVY